MIAYLLDTHFGTYDQPMPAPDTTVQRHAALLEEASLADELGFDGVYLPDRHGRTECSVPAPLAFLAALSGRVRRARLGIYSLVLTAYHPMAVAEEAALVDLLCSGRLTLSLSMGYHPAYWAQFGINGAHRVSRFEEALDILDLAWRGERFSYSGKRFCLTDVLCAPTPYQPGGPTRWIGGQSPQQIQRAATRAEGWAAGLGPFRTESWLRAVDSYRSQAQQAGRTAHVAVMRDAFVADTYEEAVAAVGEAIVAEQLFYFNALAGKVSHPDLAKASDFTIDNLRQHLVIGSPDDCIESIARYRDELSIDTLILRFRFPNGPSLERTREALAQFGEEVLPRL